MIFALALQVIVMEKKPTDCGDTDQDNQSNLLGHGDGTLPMKFQN